MKEKYSLVLVDGSSYLFRAFHALPKLMSTKGAHTGAMKGVISMIKKLINDNPESQIAVIFDAKGKSFRNDIYPEYKANRAAMPDELREQIGPIHEIIKRMGVPLLIVDGVEADDVIGTLAARATEQKLDVLISTGDKDMAQLVNNHITLVNTMNEVVMNPEGVVEKFGVRPNQIIDYLALVGDTSDNIPGVPKCGPKTAVKWLDAYQTVTGVIAHADEVKGKVGEYLRDSLETLPMSYLLATIKLDVQLDVGPEALEMTPADTSALRALYTEYEFRQWLEELHEPGDEAKPEQSKVVYEMVTTLPELERWVDALQTAEVFAFDTETTSLDYMVADLVGVSFSVAAGEAAYVPVAHTYIGAPEQLSLDDVMTRLKPLLEDPNKKKVGQNLKYDMSVLARYGITLRGVTFDTMLESYVLNSVASRHNMDDLALKYLGKETISFETVAGKGAKQITFDQVPLDVAGPYAAEDADITLQLHQNLWPKLEAIPSLKHIFESIELPLLTVLSRIERNGVLLDSKLLDTQSAQLGERLVELQKEAFELAGETFNLGSPRQLQVILFEKLGLPIKKKTPKGQPSTAEDVLQELALDYPLPKVITEYRGLSKLKSTYTDQLPKQINAASGRVHTSYHQAVAATGRLSSTDPNLQNIPIRTEQGRRIRKAFIAPTGYKLIAADYSQIELRIMAHLSSDAGLLSAFSQGLDIHKATAAEVFGRELADVTADQRRSAKAIN
ncbi:MAG: DNA polymerase-1, partial [Candidatus Azotimanducaceae bacterium]